MRRSQEQWKAVLEEHKASGLTAKAYCQANHIDLKYFGKKRRELRSSLLDNAPKTEAFICMNVAPTEKEPPPLELHYQGQCLKLPSNISTNWLSQLMNTLHRGQ